MKGVHGSDLGASCNRFGESLHLRAFLCKPCHRHPLRQHPDIDIEDHQLDAKEEWAWAQGFLEDQVVALDINFGCLFDTPGAHTIGDIAGRK
jgi:hypothetical protein